jgi:hypothetical protein
MMERSSVTAVEQVDGSFVVLVVKLVYLIQHVRGVKVWWWCRKHLLCSVPLAFKRNSNNRMAIPCRCSARPGQFFARSLSLLPSAATSFASMADAAMAAAGVAPAAAVVAAAMAAMGAGVDPAAARMANLVASKKALAAQKAANVKAIKNEVKKKKRLQEKAKQLSTVDLLEVLATKVVGEAKAKAKAKAKAAAAPPVVGE